MNITESRFVFEGDDLVPECHASTLVVLNNNTIITAWFAGTAESKNDVSIWYNRRVNGLWGEPSKISADDGIPHWNPVLFSKDGKTVTLFFKVGNVISDWKTFFMTSSDSGETWTQAKELVQNDCSGGRGPVKNKPLLISNGNILAPASVERGQWRCFIDLYNGTDWKKCSIPVSDKEADNLAVIQPTLWQGEGGNIYALLRSNKGRIYRSHSIDYGKTWAECYPTDIPNNNSGIDAVKIQDKLFLVCNPVEKNWGARSPLSIFVSEDDGISFEKLIDLETEIGEFSYPSVVASEKKLYITYTWKRKKIMFSEINVDGFLQNGVFYDKGIC